MSTDYWHDDGPRAAPYAVPEDVVDVAYRIACRELPVDHVHALASALQAALPWLASAEHAGVHPIHGAESGNGWQRPQAPDDVLHLSRRTRLRLRLPAERVAAARALVGTTLQVAGRALAVGEMAVRPLRSSATLFSRYVASAQAADEAAFLVEVAEQLRAIDVPAHRLLAGRLHALRFPGGPVRARSLLVAGLAPPESVRLQEHGLGRGRASGCGLFVPHRGIEAVGGAAR